MICSPPVGVGPEGGVVRGGTLTVTAPLKVPINPPEASRAMIRSWYVAGGTAGLMAIGREDALTVKPPPWPPNPLTGSGAVPRGFVNARFGPVYSQK